MFRYLFALVAVCFSLTVQAQGSGEEINVVIFAPKSEIEKSLVVLPSCDDPAILAAVAARIDEYQKAHPAASIVSRRKQKLLVKSLKAFVEVPVADFDNASNYEVAKELVMTKINYRIPERDMRLCRGGESHNIYLLMYPEGSGVRVQILNFVPSRSDGNDFSIYYAPEVQSNSDQEVENTDIGSDDDGRSQKAENLSTFDDVEHLLNVEGAESQQHIEELESSLSVEDTESQRNSGNGHEAEE